jgi:uncharacterized lipoprotein YehR (DUF1307 family)
MKMRNLVLAVTVALSLFSCKNKSEAKEFQLKIPIFRITEM